MVGKTNKKVWIICLTTQILLNLALVVRTFLMVSHESYKMIFLYYSLALFSANLLLKLRNEHTNSFHLWALVQLTAFRLNFISLNLEGIRSSYTPLENDIDSNSIALGVSFMMILAAYLSDETNSEANLWLCIFHYLIFLLGLMRKNSLDTNLLELIINLKAVEIFKLMIMLFGCTAFII